MPSKASAARGSKALINSHLHELRSSVADVEMFWPDHVTFELLSNLSNRLQNDRTLADRHDPGVVSVKWSIGQMEAVLRDVSEQNILAVEGKAPAGRGQEDLVRSWVRFTCCWISERRSVLQDRERDVMMQRQAETLKHKTALEVALQQYWNLPCDSAGSLPETAPTLPPVTPSKIATTDVHDSHYLPTPPDTISPAPRPQSNIQRDVGYEESDDLVPGLGLERWSRQYKLKQGKAEKTPEAQSMKN